jgi:5-methylcytosine-specific restriction endonuclease McrBC regulatory subunit McrC
MMQVDFMDEYRKTHWNDILKKETAKAVEEALKKSSAADQHSSTPNSATGKPDAGNPAKINTVAGLNDLLKDVK